MRLVKTLFLCGLIFNSLTAGVCPCDSVITVVDDFEQDCGEIPCRWTTDSGVIRRTTTYHQGQHGMHLEAGTVARLDLAMAGLDRPDTISVVARCDAGGSIRVVFEGTAGFRLDGGGEGGLMSVDATFLPSETEGATLRRLTERVTWNEGAPLEVRVEVDGAACTLDDLLISSAFCG